MFYSQRIISLSKKTISLGLEQMLNNEFVREADN